MAKAGSGGAGAGGNGALTWVVSGGRLVGGGPAAALFLARCGAGIPPGRLGVGVGRRRKRGKSGSQNGRPVGVSSSRTPPLPAPFLSSRYRGGGSGCRSIMYT